MTDVVTISTLGTSDHGKSTLTAAIAKVRVSMFRRTVHICYTAVPRRDDIISDV
jgi:translation elongation factor EF-Tu-like GTPase